MTHKTTDPAVFRRMINQIFFNNAKSAEQRNNNIKVALKTYDGPIDDAEKDEIASFIIFGKKDLSLARKYEVDKEAREWAA